MVCLQSLASMLSSLSLLVAPASPEDPAKLFVSTKELIILLVTGFSSLPLATFVGVSTVGVRAGMTAGQTTLDLSLIFGDGTSC